MKRVVFILIFALVFFNACTYESNNSSEPDIPTQIDPKEEFDGVLFGMTMEEVINTIGRQPDDYSQVVGVLTYNNLVFLNVNAYVMYFFKNDRLTSIDAYYEYHGISGIEQLLNDYRTIQEELLKRYPGESNVSGVELVDFYYIKTQNRDVWVDYYDNTIAVTIKYSENTETPDSTEP